MPLRPEEERPLETTHPESRPMEDRAQRPEPVLGDNIVPLTRGNIRADDGIRTRDPHLGKVMLYQLSHVRVRPTP